MNIKLVIWDLDDTLWDGTLADGDAVRLNGYRAGIIPALNRCGVISSICSKNDPARARATLQEFGLWDEFVFPRIAFAPKAQAIQQMIEDMQLRPANVLFIDNDIHNLEEAKALLPELRTANASLPEGDEILQKILDENRHIKKNRVQEYRQLQARHEDRRSRQGSNEDFLRSCDIRVTFPYLMDNLEFSARIEELVNRANQLNYTQSRLEPGAIIEILTDVMHYESWSVFMRDKYGYHGLVGFMAYDKKTEPEKLLHFVFSCRAMHMGIENLAMHKLLEKSPRLDLAAMRETVSPANPDWIKTEGLDNAEVRAMITAHEAPQARKTIEMRVMYDCQSGGIAHFSRHREAIEFDNNPRLFGMRMVLNGQYLEQQFPSMLVYGAGVDYNSERWGESAAGLNEASYRASVEKFCLFTALKSCKLLVLLPSETAPDEMYRAGDHTRERTIAFNAIWRQCAGDQPHIDLLEISTILNDSDMPDVRHFYASGLKKMAEHVDSWYDANLGK